jgi:hypothetical protein
MLHQTQNLSTSNDQQKYPHLANNQLSSIRPDTSDNLHLERGKMTRTRMLFLIALSIVSVAFAVPTPAHAQPGYGQQRITCSSNNG